MNIPHRISRSNTAWTRHRLQAALLTAVILLSAYPWDGTRAQTGSGTDQVQYQALSPDQPDQRLEESHELTPFFLIGIMINVVALTLFAVWAAREWKKKRPERRAGDQ